MIEIAPAGVGIPINELVWRVSILNLAKRSAENMAITKEESTIVNSFALSCERMKLSFSPNSEMRINLNMIIVGATPKLTISANESSSLPISELALSKRAAKPSEKSKMAAMAIKRAE